VIDGADVNDRPNPGHESAETQGEGGKTKLAHGFAFVAGVKIMRAEKTEQRAEDDEGAAIFRVGIGIDIEIKGWRRGRAGAGTGGASKNMLPTPTRAAGRAI